MANKNDLVVALHEAQGITKKQARKNIDDVFTVIQDALKHDGIVKIPGFGRFAVSDYPERQTHSVAENKLITIPAHNVVKFRVSAPLKNAVK